MTQDEFSQFKRMKAISISEEILNRFDDLVRKDDSISEFEGALRKFVVPPLRDSISEHNKFVMSVFYVFKKLFDIANKVKADKEKDKLVPLSDLAERLEDTIKDGTFGFLPLDPSGFIDFIFEDIYIDNVLVEVRARDVKYASWSFIYYYHYIAEVYLRNRLNWLLICIMFDNIMSDSKPLRVTKTKKGGKIKFESSSEKSKELTVIDVKKITTVKEIKDIEDVELLTLGEIYNLLRKTNYKVIYDTVRGMCDIELRNRIAHGRFKVDEDATVILKDGWNLSLEDFLKRVKSLVELVDLFDVGVVLSICKWREC
jgi:hypothetical protein